MSATTNTDEVVEVTTFDEADGWKARPTEVFGPLSDECRSLGESMGFEYSPDGLFYREVVQTVLGAILGTP
jgi:hypothetical protein